MGAENHHNSLTSIAPLFIVRDVTASIGFYGERLGFELARISPPDEPVFAVVARDAIQILLKAVLPEIGPLPNYERHPWARWDAFVDTPDPDALAAEMSVRGTTLRTPVGDVEERLRGFEVQDLDGYVLFFGRRL